LTEKPLTMYTYIVERTQIYLTREQARALDREAKRSGTTRSHLIREAVEERYAMRRDASSIEAALRASAGAWTGRRESGAAYVERLRTGKRWQELYPDDAPGSGSEETRSAK
jgi:predicted DNA-binding protein